MARLHIANPEQFLRHSLKTQAPMLYWALLDLLGEQQATIKLTTEQQIP
jgi:hypothetical protein